MAAAYLQNCDESAELVWIGTATILKYLFAIVKGVGRLVGVDRHVERFFIRSNEHCTSCRSKEEKINFPLYHMSE